MFNNVFCVPGMFVSPSDVTFTKRSDSLQRLFGTNEGNRVVLESCCFYCCAQMSPLALNPLLFT